MNPHDLRKRFLEFFAERGHEVVPSSPVVPRHDPTLLFTNAGMNQFKEVFLGLEERDYKRAASAQKCIRAGGKHNDLDEVGRDGTHLTFFEMLGNWSFGDYYKAESIRWGWEFLTEVLGLDPDRLYVTTYKDDDESWEIWRDQIGIPESRMQRMGDIEQDDEENFWSMGPTGPCGPCTEMHYDFHPESGDGWGPEFDGLRYLEVWNHVFMEFDRADDGTLTPLPMKSVDTGMGLERIACVVEGVDSVYATGLFSGILETLASKLGLDLSVEDILARDEVTAWRAIADHVRTITFAISEGQPFSNEGRGYVLRRILRRAARYGRELGLREPFLHELAQAVIDDFGGAYPELRAVSEQTREVIRLEEERFFRTLDRGIARFKDVAERSKDENLISGEDAFTLYDTYGFPLDLTEIMAEERGMDVDVEGFEEALEEQRRRSAEAAQFYDEDEEVGPWIEVRDGNTSTFVGYARTETPSRIMRYRSRGERYEILLDITPFYAESGGQVGDTGTIAAENGGLRFRVLDTQRTEVGIVHLAQLEEGFVNDESMARDVVATVDAERRRRIQSNHTATHLLHAALRGLVSEDIHQAGSLVRDDKLRFDFTYPKALTSEQIERIELWVNQVVREAHELKVHVDVPREQAKEWGAMAIFGEKYDDRVRVIEIPKLSMELCGGCHVANTQELLMFRVMSESAIAAGTRRIEAVTNAAALEAARDDRRLLERAADTAKVDRVEQLPERIRKLQAEKSDAAQRVDQLARRVAKAEVGALLADKRGIDGLDVVGARVDVADRKQRATS